MLPPLRPPFNRKARRVPAGLGLPPGKIREFERPVTGMNEFRIPHAIGHVRVTCMKQISLCLLSALCALSARATLIAGGDGTGNTDGTGAAGWEYTGKINHATANSSVTYVGNRWFVTAYHVKYFDNPTGVVFNATTYGIDQNSWTRITNSTGTKADLVLFKVNESVAGVSNPSIASQAPDNGTAVTMIGNGRNRASSLTRWKSDWTETTNPSEAAYSGYKWAAGSTKRWGSNTADGTTNISYNVGAETDITDVFYTDFDNVAGEGHGAMYDSGGGVFTGTTNQWSLAGIMITVDPYAGQPASTAVFGNRMYIADLSVYRDQIMQAIPEPSTALLAIGSGAAWIVFRRFRRRRIGLFPRDCKGPTLGGSDGTGTTAGDRDSLIRNRFPAGAGTLPA